MPHSFAVLSSSSTSSSASSVVPDSKHDVFLSFRGMDTRNNFTSHLEAGLGRKCISVFIDKNLERGEEISSSLLKKIEESRLSIVIFSKNYASSSWCLDELVHIMKCREETDHIVLPVFYGITPSDVRHQTGSYDFASLEHYKDNPNKVQQWKKALTDAANLSGYLPELTSESLLVEEIAKEVLKKLSSISNSTHLNHNLLGMDKRLQEMESLLCLANVRIIGTWDMPSIGKTTLAQSVKDKFSSLFDESCFLDDMPSISGNSMPSSTTEPSNVSPNWRFKRSITYWQKGELLGRGSFGSVYEGIADDGFFFAVKEVSLLDQGDQGRQSISQLKKEIALLSQFEHENIVQYYGTDKDESKLYIFLELVTKGSLQRLYQRYNLRDSQVSAYTRQILHCLKYLHDRNVVHRDIKCANILVDASGSVKLADFGLAKAITLNDAKSIKGTACWMAPEVINRRYGLPADIWSLGCTVLEMLTQKIPYSDLEWMQALCNIAKGVLPTVPESLSKDARDFIFKCLQVNADHRPTAAQLLDHPFVKKPLPTSSGSASPYIPGVRT